MNGFFLPFLIKYDSHVGGEAMLRQDVSLIIVFSMYMVKSKDIKGVLEMSKPMFPLMHSYCWQPPFVIYPVQNEFGVLNNRQIHNHPR